MTRTVRSFGLRVARYIVGFAVLGWVISRGEWEGTIDTLGRISPTVVGVLVVLAVGGVAFRALMWHSIINHRTSVTFSTAVEIDLVVNFLNQLAPSRLSGRSVAPLVVRQRTGLNIGSAAGVVGVNTGLYALVYAAAALFGIAAIAPRLGAGLLVLLLLSALLYLVAGGLVLLGGLNVELVDRFVVRLVPVVDRIPVIGERLSGAFDRVPEFTGYSADVFRETLVSPRVIGIFLVGWIGSLAIFPALRVYVLFGSLGGSYEPFILLPFVLIAAYGVTLLPLTPGGIGVTEATATLVFAGLGVPYEVAASAILVDRVLGVYLPALLGWFPTVRSTSMSVQTE